MPLSGVPVLAAREADVVIRASAGAFPAPGALLRGAPEEAADWWVRVYEDEHGIQYRHRQAGCFWIEPCGRQVWYRAQNGARPIDIEHLLTGPILGLALQLQGQVVLHAGAVQVDGRAVAFAGPHGTGKSTLAAAFTRAGYPLLTDDALPITNRRGIMTAARSLPRIKLWGDSLAALGEDAGRYDRVVSWHDKRRVAAGADWGMVAADDLPLAAVYLLAPRADAHEAIAFADPRPAAATLALIGNMFQADALRGDRAVRAFDAAARTAVSVRVREVSYRRTFDELTALCEAIVADVRGGSERR